MFWRRHTDEFSIILPIDENASADIQNLRSSLSISPYHDDRPHLTILGGISSHSRMSDKQLRTAVATILDPILSSGLIVIVKDIINVDTKFYGRCSMVNVEMSETLSGVRDKIMGALEDAGFIINEHAKSVFHPHFTIRLGVPLDQMANEEAHRLFPKGRAVELDGWIIHRLISNRGKRRFYEIQTA